MPPQRWVTPVRRSPDLDITGRLVDRSRQLLSFRDGFMVSQPTPMTNRVLIRGY